MMHCRSQNCWELLHTNLQTTGQHGRDNSQHSGANNVGSCCVRLHTTANTDATTPLTILVVQFLAHKLVSFASLTDIVLLCHFSDH